MKQKRAHCCCSVTKSCLTDCIPINCSMPGFPVLHYLPEFAQIHVQKSKYSHPFKNHNILYLNVHFNWKKSEKVKKKKKPCSDALLLCIFNDNLQNFRLSIKCFICKINTFSFRMLYNSVLNSFSF